MEQRELLNGQQVKAKTEIFTGRGNTEEQACQGAEVRYYTWKMEQKRAGYVVNEISISRNYKRHNDVHVKCEIEVAYTLSTI